MDEVYNVIEEMTLSNYQWSNECDQPKRAGGKLEVNALNLLTVKADAMTPKWTERI